MLTLRIERGWVFVFHVDEAAGPVPSEAGLLSELLKLSADIAPAKVGLDLEGRLVVVSNTPLRDLSPQSLQESIGACLSGVSAARSIVAGERRFQLN